MINWQKSRNWLGADGSISLLCTHKGSRFDSCPSHQELAHLLLVFSCKLKAYICASVRSYVKQLQEKVRQETNTFHYLALEILEP